VPKNPKEESADAAPAPAEPAAEAPTEKGGKKERGPKGKGEPKEGGDEKPTKGKGKGKGAPGAASTKKTKPIPDNPNFRYIVRVSNTDLDGRRATALALTGVRGVGLRMAEVTCRLAQVNPSEMIGNLPETTVDGLETILTELPTKVPTWMVNHPKDYVTGDAAHLIGPDLETGRRDDINLMKMVRSYRGVRHERGQKVRGQRTRSNGRTGMAAGVLKKDAKAAAAAAGKTEGGAAAPAAAATPAPAAAPAAAEKKKE
jgi:small subunit ribosomal protein S13